MKHRTNSRPHIQDSFNHLKVITDIQYICQYIAIKNSFPAHNTTSNYTKNDRVWLM